MAPMAAEERRRVLGFHLGHGTPHDSRTIMLAELSTLFASTATDAARADYANAVVDDNVLGKTSAMNRKKSLKLLVRLYGLDAQTPLFRALRKLWSDDEASQPMLAALTALARDEVMLASWTFLHNVPYGSVVTSVQFGEALQPKLPHLSPKMARSMAQNLAASWAQSGHLHGTVRKSRQRPRVTPAVVALALFIGYLQGRRGLRLFGTVWTEVLELSEVELMSMAVAASQRGLLQLLRSGPVVEVRFPGLLTAEEEELCHESP